MKNEKYTAIICEYNPFHNGHAYQISEARKQSDIIICIMSGNTVQRGGFACTDKYERAKSAIDNGADIVVEHPFPFCMTSASDFATSGVYIASSLMANQLAFGHESDSEILLELTDILHNNKLYDEIFLTLKEKKENKNLSFPKLRELALNKIIENGKADALKLPNNILSVEYLLNIKKYPEITPLFIKRNFNFISAGEIRRGICSGRNVSDSMPKIYEKYFDFSKCDLPILSKIITSGKYENVYDCDFSLYNRIVSKANKATSIDELVHMGTSSAYTSSKVRRAVYSMFFGVTSGYVKSLPSYTVLLGASSKGLEYISKNKKKFKIPLLTRAKDEKKYNVQTDFGFLPDKIYKLYEGENFIPYQKPYLKFSD